MVKKQKQTKIKRLGKLTKKQDDRNLQLTTYTKGIIPLPPSVDHASRLEAPVNIGNMTNDVWNTCTVATAGHMIQSWTEYSDRGMLSVADDEILAAYHTIEVGDDGGAYALDAMNMWRNRGVGGENIEAFVEIDAGVLGQAKLAILYFGSVYAGLSLPDKNTFGPWTTVTGPLNVYNGHVANLCAYDDETRMFKCCTWGRVVDMSYDWYETYCDEAYAAADNLSLNESSGETPEGFDWPALMADIGNLSSTIPTSAPTKAPTQIIPPVNEPKEDKKSKKMLLIGGGIAVAIIIVLMMAFGA